MKVKANTVTRSHSKEDNMITDSAPNTVHSNRSKALYLALLIVLALYSGWQLRSKNQRDLNLSLIEAVHSGDTDEVDSLLRRGANPNIRDVIQQPSSLWQYIQLVFHSDLPPEMFAPPLVHAAVAADSYSVVESLLRHGANLRLCDKDGKSPLHYLVEKGPRVFYGDGEGVKIAALLIQSGSDVNAVDKAGRTALMNDGLYVGSNTLFRFLLAHGANTNVQSRYEGSPLFVASKHLDIQAVQLLLDHGVDVNVCDTYKVTPLHTATVKGNLPLIELLLAHGAKIDAPDWHGDTPLTAYLQQANNFAEELDVLRELIANGVDVNHRNNAGKSPLSLVMKRPSQTLLIANNAEQILDAKRHNQEIIEILEAAGAKP